MPTRPTIAKTSRPAAGAVPGWLERLREEARLGRIARRCDLDAACASLGTETCPWEAMPSPGLVFLRAVASARGTPLALRRPGSASLSFDESWILCLILSIRAGDWASAAFALRSRLPRAEARRIRFLAGLVSDGLDAPGAPPISPYAASHSQPAARTCNEG